ncbi:MAG TPA: response regulator transcription factor [Solirubrobacteraceae bacterium]|nr:response regulator transcription factor [Solirubrobacteraceae bacterium]
MASAVVKVRSSAAADRMTSERIVLIAGHGPREKLAEILRLEDSRLLVFDDVRSLLARSSESSPAMIVLWLDDTASGLTGCVEPLTRAYAETPILLACTAIERWSVRAALTAGVAGVVLSKDLSSALGPCMQAVRAGQTCVPRAHWRQLEPPALSSREKQILGLVVMGYMNGQIAQQLFLAESTIKSHLSSAFRKLGVRSRNEAVNLILDPERGLGMGILALGGEPVGPPVTTAQ